MSAVLAIIVAVVAAMFLPSVRRSGEAAWRSQCKNNLKQIGIALHNYADDYGAFPPACTVDSEGNPLHSWRTLILPYFDQKELYAGIDLSRPWNDAANADAYAKVIHQFACHSADLPPGHTTYLAFVGTECGFHPTQPRRLDEFLDGISNTVWVVDASPAESVHWMNPTDSGNRFFMNFNYESELSHTGGIQTLLADGTVRFLSTQLAKDTRHALIAIADGKTLGEF